MWGLNTEEGKVDLVRARVHPSMYECEVSLLFVISRHPRETEITYSLNTSRDRTPQYNTVQQIQLGKRRVLIVRRVPLTIPQNRCQPAAHR